MRKAQCVPLIYHPTNILCLDDNEDFLQELGVTIAKSMSCILFSDPKEALSYLENHTYRLDNLSAIISEQDFRDWAENDTDMFQLNFKLLHSDLTSPERFKKVVEMFIDQHMPMMDGLIFCEKVREKKLSVQSVVLTGLMGMQDAIKQFNNHVIDGYLKKEAADLGESLKTIIAERAWRQFQELTVSLTGSLSHLLKPIYDKNFINLFEKIKQQYNIFEFYMLDASCSYLLIDNAGRTRVLLVRKKEDFQDAYDFGEDHGAPSAVLAKIKDYEAYPYSSSSKDYLNTEGKAWESLIVPMTQVPNTDFYYSLMDGPKLEVFSFDRYCQEVWQAPM